MGPPAAGMGPGPGVARVTAMAAEAAQHHEAQQRGKGETDEGKRVLPPAARAVDDGRRGRVAVRRADDRALDIVIILTTSCRSKITRQLPTLRRK